MNQSHFFGYEDGEERTDHCTVPPTHPLTHLITLIPTFFLYNPFETNFQEQWRDVLVILTMPEGESLLGRRSETSFAHHAHFMFFVSPPNDCLSPSPLLVSFPSLPHSLFSAGLQKCPWHIPLYHGSALLELREDNLDVARKLVTDALTKDRTKAVGWVLLSQVEERAGHDGLVSLLLRRGIECAPNEPSLYCELGDHLVNKGKINDAREIMEEGLRIDPLYAPLYHSLAKLEARIFNIEALSNLNKKAAALFQSNALEPPPSLPSEVWGEKVRTVQAHKVPRRVAVLADRIGESVRSKDDEDVESVVNTLESMSRTEDEMVATVFGDDLEYE